MCEEINDNKAWFYNVAKGYHTEYINTCTGHVILFTYFC